MNVNFSAQEQEALVGALLNDPKFTENVALKSEFNQLALEIKDSTKRAEAVAQKLMERASERTANGRPAVIKHSLVLRSALAARNQMEVTPQERAAAETYAKVLVTGSTPGSYLVPTMQSGESLPILAIGGVVREMGARIWPVEQKLNIPYGLSTPTWAYATQTGATSPSDPNLGQIAFDLKERRTLVAIPRALLRASSPAADSLIEELISIGAGVHEDNAFFATSAPSNGPTGVYANVANETSHLVGESANGGDLAYSDLVRTIRKAVAAKAKGPFVWGMSPRTFFDRIIGMVDQNDQPIFQRDPAGKILGFVLGYPVFVSPEIPEDQANGSGTNQSYLVFTNPKYLQIGDAGSVEIALSEERYFEYNQIAIRGVHSHDFGFGPPLGVVVLKGIN